jgi:hypothetical protein
VFNTWVQASIALPLCTTLRFRHRVTPRHLVFRVLVPHYEANTLPSGCIVSVLRLHSLVGISNSTDPTFENPPAATWSSVEINVGIICSCLPCLRPLLVRSFPHIFSSGHGTGPSNFVNGYGHHISEHGTRLENLNSKHSRRSSDVDSRNIQVVTQIRVSVEDKDDGGSVDTRAKDLRGEVDPGSSTETLVRDAGKVV